MIMLANSAFLTIMVPAGPDDIGVSTVQRMNTSIAWKIRVFMMLLSWLALSCPVNAPAMNTKRLVQKLTFCCVNIFSPMMKAEKIIPPIIILQ